MAIAAGLEAPAVRAQPQQASAMIRTAGMAVLVIFLVIWCVLLWHMGDLGFLVPFGFLTVLALRRIFPVSDNITGAGHLTYTGERNSDGKRHGQGTMTYGYGNTYSGEWKDGNASGQGAIKYADGGTYTGEWKDGNASGQGAIKYADGGTYTGEWKDGERHGHGNLTYADGTAYTGEFKGGERHGQGIITDADGSSYSGQWKDGLPVP